jgi:hypothetical protein
MRVFKNRGMLNNNIFLDNTKLNCISVCPLDNRLSDHDIQIPVLQNIQIPLQKMSHKSITRLINDETLVKFQSLLGAWESVFNADNVNGMFNNFHCVFLRNYEICFPIT